MGKIVFRQHGMIETYDCTCGGDDCEPSDCGAHCGACGAFASWPHHQYE